MIREDIVNSYGYKVAKASVNYSQKYAKDDELQGIVMDTFEDAAEFGYNLAIEKACEWFKEQSCCGYIEDIDVNEFVEQFKQAMEGE